MPEDRTRVLPPEPSGTWSNPAVVHQNRHLNLPPIADHYRAPAPRPFLYGTRIIAVLCLLPLLVGLILSASLAHWAQHSLVEDDGFSLISADMVNDQQLQDNLRAAVVSDIMSSSAIQNSVGDGNSSGFWGGVQNWAYDTLKTTVQTTVDGVFNSADYPELWQEVMDASHTYNMNNPELAGIDIAPIFNAVDAKIGTILGFDPDFTKSTFIVPLESSDNRVLSNNIQILKDYGATWQPQLIATVIFALLIILLAPTARFWWTFLIAILSSLSLWLTSLLVGTFELPRIGSETAQIFANGLTEAFTANLKDHLSNVATSMLFAALLIFLLATIMSVVKLSAKGATARTQRILKALG